MKRAKATKKITEHSTTFAQFAEAAGRLNNLRAVHATAVDLMWAGTLSTQFSDHELGLLRAKGCLSPMDESLIRQARSGGAA
jgi:hypothetical protein